jgi:hypothetical protein
MRAHRRRSARPGISFEQNGDRADRGLRCAGARRWIPPSWVLAVHPAVYARRPRRPAVATIRRLSAKTGWAKLGVLP